jgi:DNA-binding beta-propeller fold protein YncE
MGVFSLTGCGGGGGDDEMPSVAVVDAEAPMRASTGGPQFQAVARTHSLAITGTDGRLRRYGGVGKSQGKLNFPTAVVVINGLAYVVETGNHRVQVFDSSGASRKLIGEGELLYPSAIAAGLNEILVSDSRHSRVVGFSLDGRITRVLGAGALSAPRGLTLLGTSVLVADPGLRKVFQLGADGRVQGELGSGWVLPWDVATDGKYAYVADASRNEIAVVALSGKRIGSMPLNFAPANVAFRNGTVVATPQV